MKIRIGTRSSELAVVQADIVGDLLRAIDVTVETVPFSTRGDEHLDVPIPEVGGKGVFTAELEHALISGSIDIAVHSLKDLPTEQTEGIKIGAVLDRGDARDALVSVGGERLRELPNGARVATGSPRRKAQILALRPDMTVHGIRGNVPTRLAAVEKGEFDGIVLAAAGLLRLGRHLKVAELFDIGDVVPAPGQGSLGVQCREEDELVSGMLGRIADPYLSATTSAERAFLAALEGGCSTPIGAYCVATGDELVLTGRVTALDGSKQETVTRNGPASAPAALGRAAAVEMKMRGGDEVAVTLDGQRILVTRPERTAQTLCDAIERANGVPVRFPVIQIQTRTDDVTRAALRRDIRDIDWVVFTSVNGVEAFHEIAGPVAAGAMRFAAVGSVTARRVEDLFGEAVVVPNQFTAGDIPGVMGLMQNDIVLVVKGSLATEALPDALRLEGAQVRQAVLYDTVNTFPGEAEWTAAQKETLVTTFASGSAVRSFLDQVPGAAGFLAEQVVASIGPATTSVAESVGVRVDVTAATHSSNGLVESLQRYLEGR